LKKKYHSLDLKEPEIYCPLCGTKLELEEKATQVFIGECPKDTSFKNGDDYRHAFLIRTSDEGLIIEWSFLEHLKDRI